MTLLRTEKFNINIWIGVLNQSQSIIYDILKTVWWQISDSIPTLMKQCEVIAKLVCDTSELKSDKQHLRNELWTTRICECCDLFELEDARHVIISCPRGGGTQVGGRTRVTYFA